MTSHKRSDLFNKWGCMFSVKFLDSMKHTLCHIYLFAKAKVRAGLNSIYFPSPKKERRRNKKMKKLPSRSERVM